MMLDATAGNRIMWRHANYNPPHVIFIDYELKLARPPTVFADNRHCPFRDDVFDCIIYDPPYYVRDNKDPWIFYNPEMKRKKRKPGGGDRPGHFGFYRTKIELFSNLFQASKEFSRLGKRLCFKWGTGDFSLWKILPFFKPWKEIYRKQKRSGGIKKKTKTVWVTFINSEFTNKGEERCR